MDGELDRYAQMAIDHGVDDEDPVLDSPNRCVDCGKLGTEVPVMVHPEDPEKRCDPCWAKSVEYGRSHLGNCGESEEIFYDFHVRVGVRIKRRDSLELANAKLRAQEILLGLPMVDDRESWEYELVDITDEAGTQVPDQEL